MFDNIKFPLFGVKHYPEEIEYREDFIGAWIKKQGFCQVSDYIPNETYTMKLLRYDQQRIHRVKFDITIRSVPEFIRGTAKIKWGIDNKCQLFDFRKKYRVPTKTVKVERILNNNVYVKGITYPYPLPIPIDSTIIDIRGLYANLVKHQNTWYLYKFANTSKEEKLKL